MCLQQLGFTSFCLLESFNASILHQFLITEFKGSFLVKTDFKS